MMKASSLYRQEKESKLPKNDDNQLIVSHKVEEETEVLKVKKGKILGFLLQSILQLRSKLNQRLKYKKGQSNPNP